MEKLSDEEIISRILKIIEKALPNQQIPRPVEYVITRWNTNPNTLGSYICHVVGSSPEDNKILGEPVGNILFCGEATHARNLGTVQAGYVSGVREALRLQQFILSQ